MGRILIFLLLLFIGSSVFSQSEVIFSAGSSWQRIQFDRVTIRNQPHATIYRVNVDPYGKGYLLPKLAYSRILSDYGLRVGFNVSYLHYRYDIFLGGELSDRGYTEMRFSQVPIQLHLAYRTKFGAYVGLGPSIRLFSAIELTEWDNGENDLEPFLDQGNQLYGIFGFAGYRYKHFDLRLAFERGMGWRLPSTEICRGNVPCDYNLSPVHSLSLSLGYVWESGKKKRGGKKRKRQ